MELGLERVDGDEDWAVMVRATSASGVSGMEFNFNATSTLSLEAMAPLLSIVFAVFAMFGFAFSLLDSPGASAFKMACKESSSLATTTALPVEPVPALLLVFETVPLEVAVVVAEALASPSKAAAALKCPSMVLLDVSKLSSMNTLPLLLPSSSSSSSVVMMGLEGRLTSCLRRRFSEDNERGIGEEDVAGVVMVVASVAAATAVVPSLEGGMIILSVVVLECMMCVVCD